MVSQVRKPEQTKMTTQLSDVGFGRFGKIDLSFNLRNFVMGTLDLVWSPVWEYLCPRTGLNSTYGIVASV